MKLLQNKGKEICIKISFESLGISTIRLCRGICALLLTFGGETSSEVPCIRLLNLPFG
jgi:hypothetical protein